MIFVNPMDETKDSTKCEICENGFYLKYNGTVCEPESVVAACDATCSACKETSVDSMTDNATGSLCQLCKRDFFPLNPPTHNCGTTNTTNWFNCDHQGPAYGDCFKCPDQRVSYFEQTRCDLAYTS